MSKETEPIRSRRQLREQSAQAAGAAGSPDVPVDSAPATPESPHTPPAVAPRGERESQTRARDRAALRAYNELVDPPAMNPLPSRRTLRQAQLDAERAPITSVNPVISVPAAQPNLPAHQPSAAPAPAVDTSAAAIEQQLASPAAVETGVDAPVAAPAAAPAVVVPAAVRTRSGRRAAAVSNPASRQREQLAARKSPASGTGKAAGSNSATGAEPAVSAAPDAAPVGSIKPSAEPAASAKRDAASVASAAPDSEPAASAKPSLEVAGDPATGALPVAEPATETSAPQPAPTEPAEVPNAGASANHAGANHPAMPGLVPGGSYYPVTAGPPPAAPSDDELQVLAAQKAEAERAAILSQRAQARDRLAQESAKSKRQAADPTATDNLAMVTPLEFIEVPGSNQPVMRPPTTTHVPIVSRATPRLVPARPKPAAVKPAAANPATDGQPGAPVSAPSSSVPNVSAERFDAALAARAVHRPGPGNRPLTGGRSSTLKKAEAMATGGHPTVRPAVERSPAVERLGVQRSQMPPMPADYAHGLEPLDAMTAGLGRTQRNLLIQWGSIIVGGAALVVGAIMFITALAR
ncbi:hypothetical protein ART_1033 [Arthrobacter sp. PAMC 25486]|uniref:hypothetical protein n=1 Tax=Arthrobacter sp. PAMC 25486 TaxID=1494608 RepID=UPI000535A0B7|nr:hypothetical protein [Arthrobacter sp. PAMC 25486]AIY00632.1 hypothetical protein ART_1033 [Arthrobacter sp. PAMC 25486]